MRTRETKRSAFRLATAATLCLGLTALAAAQPRLGMPDNKEHRATPLHVNQSENASSESHDDDGMLRPARGTEE